MKMDAAIPFNLPVDPIALEIPVSFIANYPHCKFEYNFG